MSASSEIEAAETSVGFLFPRVVREFYRITGARRPTANMYDGGEYAMICVAEVLSLESAVDRYRSLVLGKGLAPTPYFPFATDTTGDLLFVDCSTDVGLVSLYAHDTAGANLVALGIGLSEFLASLREATD